MLPTGIEFFGMILGIIVWWTVIYSGEKDKLDDIDLSFSLKIWAKNWAFKKSDNILLHFVVSITALFIGVHNLQILISDHFNIPDGLDEVGASVLIGIGGSFIGGLLKKAAQMTGQIRSVEELKKEQGHEEEDSK